MLNEMSNEMSNLCQVLPSGKSKITKKFNNPQKNAKRHQNSNRSSMGQFAQNSFTTFE